jgi:transcriptional regulator with XRE-family HTH domain
MSKSVGQTIKRARELREMTQREFGVAVGLYVNDAQRRVSAWETGRKPIPGKRLPVVADVLELRLEDLIE